MVSCKLVVEAFRTNVRTKVQGKRMLTILKEAFPLLVMNFDLADCDKVLRIEGESIEALNVISLVETHGFKCEILE